jgi:hypothetical protein
LGLERNIGSIVIPWLTATPTAEQDQQPAFKTSDH